MSEVLFWGRVARSDCYTPERVVRRAWILVVGRVNRMDYDDHKTAMTLAHIDVTLYF